MNDDSGVLWGKLMPSLAMGNTSRMGEIVFRWSKGLQVIRIDAALAVTEMMNNMTFRHRAKSIFVGKNVNEPAFTVHVFLPIARASGGAVPKEALTDKIAHASIIAKFVPKLPIDIWTG